MGQWRVQIAETITGNVVADVTPRDLPSFGRAITEKGSWTVNVLPDDPNNQHLDLHTYATTPGLYSWIVAYDEFICQAGPVATYGYDENTRNLSVSGGGIQRLLDMRVVRNPTGDPSDIAATANDLVIEDLTLASIARRLVEANMQQAGYELPIDLPAVVTGTHDRTYQGYDLATVWDRLDDLSKVQNGPEIDFAPRYVSGANQIRWDLAIGTPTLGDAASLAVWDYGAALTAIDVDGNGSASPCTRAFVKGSGNERTLLVGYAQDTTLIGQGYPATDYINNDHTSVTEKQTLVDYAEADLDAYAGPTETWKCSVIIDGTNDMGAQVSPGLGTWGLGDGPVFGVSGHPWITNGQYRRRILGFADEAEDRVALTLQSTLEVL